MRSEYGYAGTWGPFRSAHVPLDDRAFLYGDAVFETLRVEDHPWLAHAHWRRLAGSLAALRLPRAALTEVKRVVASRPRTAGPYALRVTVSRGAGAGLRPFAHCRIYASLRPFEPTQTAVRLRTAEPRPDAFLPWHAKHTSYLPSIVALAGAAKNTDVAWLDSRGRLLESGTGNLFVKLGGKLLTPPADGRILGGTTREVLIRSFGAKEQSVSMHELGDAEGMWVTSALNIVRPVRAIDDIPLPISKSLTLEMLREYRRVACASPKST